MRNIIRYNMKNKKVEHEYKVRKDEHVVQIENAIYIVSENELNQYLKGELEPFEFDDAPYELEENEIFIFE